ncbi:MAG: hypothetical protein ACRECT_05835 [Thermoplasmata archaeon]
MRGAVGPARACPFIGVATGALLAVLLLSSPGTSAAPPVASVPPAPSSVRLLVDPTSWWTPVGNVTPFTATWVGTPAACSLEPEWFRWSVAGGEGSVAPATGATVNFTATAVAAGVAVVAVRAAAVLDCATAATAILATAGANVTVVPQISVQNLSVDPEPVEPGETATLRGNVSGGEPPLTVRVAWGDGSSSTTNLSADAGFALSHSFSAGTYVPEVFVSDSDGLFAQASAPEPVYVSGSLVVGIVANRSAVDVAMPVHLNVTVLNAPMGPIVTSTCTSVPATAVPALNRSEPLVCTFLAPGTGYVGVQALTPSSPDTVTATLTIPVAPRPTLEIDLSSVATEVGVSGFLSFRVAAGVGPFRIAWVEGGGADSGVLSLATDGTALVPIAAPEAGRFEFSAALVDADGANASNVSTPWWVDSPLNDSIATGTSETPTGANLSMSVSVGSGVPPFLWFVAPGSVPVESSAGVGLLDAIGSFHWWAVFSLEGTAVVTVVVIDAAGAVTATTVDLPMVPAFSGAASFLAASPPVPGEFDLGVSLAGGLPPFAVNLTAADGERWNRSVAADGDVTWSFPARQNGSLSLTVVATDALGVTLEWNGTVGVPASTGTPPPTNSSSPSPPPSPTPAAASPSSESDLASIAGALAIGATVLGGFLYLARRRRARTSAPPPPDPVGVLRRIIEPADGADRSTVELLAEEAGVALDIARSTIDRLVVDGTVRTETGDDGEEVLSWSATPRA